MGGRLRKVLFSLPIAVVVGLCVFAMTPCLATCGGHDEAVTAVVRKCPRAIALLGDDAHPARLGLACGSTETSGDSGNASWNLPYTGSRGRGTVSFTAIKSDDAWQVLRAVLEVDDETIDLVACAGGAIAASAGGEPVTATFDGNVIRSTHATILTGSTCTGTLRREQGAATAHVTVQCTATAESTGSAAAPIALYDGTGTFTIDVKTPNNGRDDVLDFEDAKLVAEDGTPACRLTGHGGGGTLTIWDDAPAPGFEIVVAL